MTHIDTHTVNLAALTGMTVDAAMGCVGQVLRVAAEYPGKNETAVNDYMYFIQQGRNHSAAMRGVKYCLDRRVMCRTR